MTRFCPRCERNLELNGFSRAPERRDGIRSICKDCEGVILKARRTALKEQIFDKLGHACSRCGFSDKRALQIDHVFGGGNQEHAEIKNSDKFMKKVLADAEGLYQILCANCNWIKRMEKLEHRKQTPFTPEEIEKILQSNYGKPISEDTRRRISDAGKGKIPWNVGVPAWNRGVPRPDALKEKLSQIAIEIAANRTSEERSQIAKNREAKMTPEQRSEARRKAAATTEAKRVSGELPRHTMSEESRRKQSEAGLKAAASRTPEQKAATTTKRLDTLSTRTPEQLAETVRKRLETMAANKAEKQLKLAA